MGLFDSFLNGDKRLSDLNRYVGDFRIEEVRDSRGRIRKKAVYTGVWTVMRDTGPGTRARLWAALAMSALLAVTYARMLLLTHGSSAQLAVMIPLLAGLFPILYLLMGAVSLPFRGGPMRRDQYMHSFIRVSRSAAAVGALTLLAVIASLVIRALQKDGLFLREDRLFLVLCGIVIALAAGIVVRLRSIELTEKDNGAYAAGPIP